MQEEELEEIIVTAQYKYPSRTWEKIFSTPLLSDLH